MTDKPKAERLLLDLVRAELGHSGGVDDKGNAQNTRNEVLERIEKELTAERPGEQLGTPPRWMKLPPNEAHPNFSELHIEDDWCPKAGCVPASTCEISAALLMAANKTTPAAFYAPTEVSGEYTAKIEDGRYVHKPVLAEREAPAPQWKECPKCHQSVSGPHECYNSVLNEEALVPHCPACGSGDKTRRNNQINNQAIVVCAHKWHDGEAPAQTAGTDAPTKDDWDNTITMKKWGAIATSHCHHSIHKAGCLSCLLHYAGLMELSLKDVSSAASSPEPAASDEECATIPQRQDGRKSGVDDFVDG